MKFNPSCVCTLAIALGAISSVRAQSAQSLVAAQQALLVSNDAQAFEFAGTSVALDGDTAVVGAPYAESPDLPGAFVHVRTAGVWSEQAHLVGDDTVSTDLFGDCVAIDGDTVVVGSLPSTPNLPVAYVFVRSGATWTQQAKLVPNMAPIVDLGNLLAFDVAIDGDTVVLSIDPNNGTVLGSAQVFVRSGTTWSSPTALVGDNQQLFDGYGASVAIDADTIAVGAVSVLATSGAVPGAVHVFLRAGASWVQQAKLFPLDGASGDAFGSDVALEQDTLVVGAFRHGHVAHFGGAGYVFVRQGVVWSQQAEILPSGISPLDQVGFSVGLDGDRLVLGLHRDFDPPTGDIGAVFGFVRTGATWSQSFRLFADDPQTGSRLGWDVAVAGDTVIAGAPRRAMGQQGFVGAAYVWTLVPPFQFCFGDGTTATPCPCAPPDFVPVPSGAPGRGCANSFDVGGARLAASGSLNAAFALTALIGPSYGGFAFLAKGDDQDFGGIVAGDGVRCTTGTLVRFGGHNAGTFGEPLGVWAYPNNTQTLPVAAATAQPGGERAVYQLVYRNAAAGFCSPATTNITNAVRVFWPAAP